MASDDTIGLATDLTMAWLANTSTRASVDDVTAFLSAMHEAVGELGTAAAPAVPEETAHTPAVSIKKSLASKDHLISLIDGKPYRTLKRHLARHGLTPDQYRQRYNLPSSYPITAPSYSAARSAISKAAGLGQKSGGRSAPEEAGEASQKSAKGVKAKLGRMTAAAAKLAAQAHLAGNDRG